MIGGHTLKWGVNLAIQYAIINSALNCKAYSSFEGVPSDHRIVTAKIQLSLRKNATQTKTIVHYDCSLLNNRDIRDKYALALRNKYDALQEKTETHTLNEEYENLVNAHLEAAVEYIPTKQKLNLESHGRHLRLEKSVQTWKLPPNAIGRTITIPIPWNLKRHKMN